MDSSSVIRLVTRFVDRLKYGEPITVVSGLPRSGTSMMMNMLAAGGIEPLTDDKRQPDADNTKGYFEHERVKGLGSDRDKSWLRAARGKSVKVVSHLLQFLPADNRYRVILALRDLGEVIASQNLMLERLRQPNPIGDEHAIMHCERHLAGIRRLVGLRSNFEMLEVPYARVVESPLAWAQRIAAFVGRNLDVKSMAAVVDSSLYRNRRRSE
jgi:hypothetical protein